MRRYTDEEIARVIHVANAELQRIQGDPAPSQPWDSEDPDIKRNAVAGVKAARDGVTTSYLHEQWLKDKQAHGWKEEQGSVRPCLDEDLVHDVRAGGDHRAQLMPVDDLGRPRTGMPG
jgi:hypothetical protein